MNNIISKKDFLRVYNKYKPNLFLRIIYQYFSTDLKKSLGTKIILLNFIIFNCLGIYFDIISNNFMMKFSVYLANIPFAIWGVFSLIAFILNHMRINNIKNELGLTIEEYNFLANIYVNQQN